MKKVFISKFFSFFAGVVSTADKQSFIRDYLREFSKKFKMILMGYSGARGTLICEKNLKSKISCQTPFNADYFHYHTIIEKGR
jgi:hypothetical protein